ncbi:MAG TPA: hypothetical protein VGH92_14355 [Gaiellaceae bacterium]|jgi:hypothetical protein
MPTGSPIPRWVPGLLGLVAVGLIPWTLYLTFTLPSRHLTEHYDLAWVGFDIALAVAMAATAWAAYRRQRWLVPLAAVAGTMLLCDAWFDVVTSQGGSEVVEAALEAVFAELPLATLCAWVVLDVERFQETLDRFRRPTPAARRAALRAMQADARAERREARARPDRRG